MLTLNVGLRPGTMAAHSGSATGCHAPSVSSAEPVYPVQKFVRGRKVTASS